MNYAAAANQMELEGMPRANNRFVRAWRESNAELSAYFKDAEREGGLLVPAIAAGLCGASRGRLNQLMEEGRFTRFQHFGRPWISRREFEAWIYSERDKGGRPPKAEN